MASKRQDPISSRARDPVFGELVSAAEFLVFAHRLQRVVNKSHWRRLRQRRASFLAALLRAIQRALGSHYSHRERRGRIWHIFAVENGEVVEAVRVHMPAQHREKDFKVPLDIQALRPDLIDEAQLLEWAELIKHGPARPTKQARSRG